MNILYLLADQMRYDALSCNGAPVCRTPNLDELAVEGARFTHAYTPNALCSPARASILTGLYPHNHGQLANTGNFNGVFDQSVLKHETYFSLLKSQGYRTGYIGKWHLEKDGDGDFWGIDQWHPSRDFRTEGTGDRLRFRDPRSTAFGMGGRCPFLRAVGTGYQPAPRCLGSPTYH